MVVKEGKECLYAQYKFKTFKRTWQWLKGVAESADHQRHHPEIFTVYNRVEVWLTTHDKGNVVTEKDVKLAEEMESLLKELPKETK